MSETWTWVLLVLAGGAGAMCRFEVDAAVARARARRAVRGSGTLERHTTGVPLGTLVVNATACLLLGLLTGGLGAPGLTSLLTILGTGFCGGYSTFSTACVESARLILAGRTRAGLLLALVMTLSCQAAVIAGLVLGSQLR